MESKKGRRRLKKRRTSVNLERQRTNLTEQDKKQDQENMEVEASVTNVSKLSTYTTLKANNKALAAALEDAQQELCLVQRENVQLKKKIYNSHLEFVEKTKVLEQQLNSHEKISENDFASKAEAGIKEVHNLLNQTCGKFVQGSNFLSEALHLLSSLLAPAEGHKHETIHVVSNSVSPYMDPVSNCVCTTPPPDEPSAMEITDIQSTIIENNEFFMKNLDRGILSNMVDQNETRKESSQPQPARCRMKRKSTTGVSYVEPGLRSKLRRGDPFTDSRLFGDAIQMNTTRKKKRSLTKGTTTLPIMGKTKKRAPLANLTNIIVEET
ncbi:unnamed protein product [Pocillopora meandrina]|uniref:Shugoshin C-terminal domain-containing protein n=1 Tax=Pocillopora meandrina TaxID=46732 RepID=A0AAU9WUZ7_9CNID|nr:unnamed protein product [Pocillopora meandrina]